MKNNKIKQLALQLHSYPDKDRHWILNSLSKVESKQLQVILSEIKINRITGNKKLIDESIKELNGLDSTEMPNQSNDLSDLIKEIDKVASDKVVQVLEKEKSWVIALLFELHNWRWQNDLEKALTPNKKMKIKQYQRKNISNIKLEVQLSVLDIVKELLYSDKNIEETSSDNIDFIFDAATTRNRKEEVLSNKKWWGGWR